MIDFRGGPYDGATIAETDLRERGCRFIRTDRGREFIIMPQLADQLAAARRPPIEPYERVGTTARYNPWDQDAASATELDRPPTFSFDPPDDLQVDNG
jgi:hypothetical protein